MSKFLTVNTTEKQYQLLRAKFIKSSGNRLIFSHRKKERSEEEVITSEKRDWLQDIYTLPTAYAYL